MKGNIPIPELPFAEEVWLMVAVISVRERRTKDGRPFREVSARNATGTLALKVWAEVLPAKYNDNTELKLEVKQGSNTQDYHLKSK